MRFYRLSSKLLRAIERLATALTSPFATARTLNLYSDRGYVLLGLFLVLVIAMLWALGQAMRPVGFNLNDWMNQLVKGWLTQNGLGALTETPLPLAVVLGLIYVVILARSSWRRPLGRAFANLTFWSLDRAVLVGELCIEHRWFSMLSIVLLIALITLLARSTIVGMVGKATDRSEVAAWLLRSQGILAAMPQPFPASEQPRLLGCVSADLAAVTLRGSLDSETASAVTRLNNALRSLSAPAEDWDKALDERWQRIDKQLDLIPTTRLTTGDVVANRTALVVSLLRARYAIRQSERLHATDMPLHSVLSALNTLDAQSLRTLRSADKLTESAVQSCNGNFYALAMVESIRLHHDAMAGDDGSHESLPKTVLRYWQSGVRSYELAAAGYERCAYEWQRSANNHLDIHIRLGLAYVEEEALRNNGREAPTPAALASALRKGAGELMQCPDRGPQTSFATAAQAYGVAAALEELSNGSVAQVRDDLRHAGALLRVSIALRRASPANMRPFRSAVSGGLMRREFREELVRIPGGVPSADVEALLERIRKE